MTTQAPHNDEIETEDDRREITPDRVILFQNHPLFSVAYQMRMTETKLHVANTQCEAWRQEFIKTDGQLKKLKRRLKSINEAKKRNRR